MDVTLDTKEIQRYDTGWIVFSVESVGANITSQNKKETVWITLKPVPDLHYGIQMYTGSGPCPDENAISTQQLQDIINHIKEQLEETLSPKTTF